MASIAALDTQMCSTMATRAAVSFSRPRYQCLGVAGLSAMFPATGSFRGYGGVLGESAPDWHNDN